MKEYRVTIVSLPGHKDSSARQGYYVTAETEAEACEYVRVRLGLREPESLRGKVMKEYRVDIKR